ncbi:hypothetical protein BC827DRAFT_20964 [Russula dissimulans]|nr:hypothetical protein BC827DRAFT_20964 [Russula dissimulans]
MSVHPSPELRSLFEAALNEFESRVGTNLVQHQIFNKLVACESIESVLDILQGQTKALHTSLAGDSMVTLMKWIKQTVHVLHSLSANHMIVSGVSLAFPPAKAVFAGIAILLSAIKDVDKSYDSLVGLFESFESFLRRLNIYTKIPPTTAITEVVVKILTELLSTISLAIQQVKQGRLKKLGKKLLGENDRKVEQILQRLDRLTLEEARMTGTTTLEVVYDLLKNLKKVMDDRDVLMDDIHRTLVDIQQVTSNMNKSRRDELQEKLRRWLSPPDPSINHNMARNARHKGTAEWFIHGSTFSQWKMGTGSLLLVHGKPGSGKTILSSSIIDDITKSYKAGLTSIVFFYFDFKDEAKKNARGSLSSFLIQLAAQSDAYSEILSALYSENHAGSKQPTDDELRESLKNMLAVPDQPPIYIVIDALDECPNSTGTPSPRENVLRLVEWLLEHQGCGKIQIRSSRSSRLKPIKFTQLFVNMIQLMWN